MKVIHLSYSDINGGAARAAYRIHHALLASGVMLATGCLTQNAARASVNWNVITTIAAAFGISAALEETGVAGAIAETLVSGASGLGAGTVGVVYVCVCFFRVLRDRRFRRQGRVHKRCAAFFGC